MASREHPSTMSKDGMVGQILPASVPIKRLPKIRITRKSKDSNMVLDGKVNSISDEVAQNDSNLDKENLVIKLRPGGGCAQSNKMEGFVAPENGNALQSVSDVITIFSKVKFKNNTPLLCSNGILNTFLMFC